MFLSIHKYKRFFLHPPFPDGPDYIHFVTAVAAGAAQPSRGVACKAVGGQQASAAVAGVHFGCAHFGCTHGAVLLSVFISPYSWQTTGGGSLAGPDIRSSESTSRRAGCTPLQK